MIYDRLDKKDRKRKECKNVFLDFFFLFTFVFIRKDTLIWMTLRVWIIMDGTCLNYVIFLRDCRGNASHLLTFVNRD